VPTRTHQQRLVARDGYFAPDSVIRRLGNSPVTPLLGGGPAVLLQVAHPLVAAGVVEHSGYGDDLWRRLVQTLRALYMIAFGTRAEADRAGEIVQAVHRHVRGRTRERLGPFPAGTPYSAEDPQLMLWVHATLVHCSLAVYDRFVERLAAEEQERYYGEMTVMARIFGTPAGVVPPTLADFREYFREQVDGDDITVTEPARLVADTILAARLPAPMRLLIPAHRLSTAGILPARIREEYGLRWSSLHELALPHAARSVRYTATPIMRAASRVARAA
jgi:uncharacterized protein (DUF2236 family)